MSTQQRRPGAALGYVVHVKTPGSLGGEARSYQMAQAMAAVGLQVHLYGQVGPDFAWAPGIYPHRLARPTPRAVAQLVREFNRYGVDVAVERYHFPVFNAGLFAQLIRRRPIILEVHGFPIDELRLMKRNRVDQPDVQTRVLTLAPSTMWERLQRKLFRRVHHFIVTSAGTKRVLIDGGVPAERVSVIYNCVDPVLFNPVEHCRNCVRASFGLPQEASVVLYAGTLSHEELEVLIQAIGALRRREKRLVLLLAGKGRASGLVELAQRAGLDQQSLRMLGPVPHQQMPGLLAAADVVLAPYTLGSERFRHSFHYSPLKVLEALAMAKPVVTVRAQELEHVFGGLPNLNFAESGSHTSWAEQITNALQLSGSPCLEAGRSFVLEGHQWRHAARSYLQVIEGAQAGAA